MTNPKLGFGAFDDDVDDDVDDEEQDGDVDDEGHDEGHDEGDDEVRNKDVNELEERRLAQLKKEQVWLDEAKSNNEKGNGEYLAGLTPQEREFRLDEQVKKREEIIQIAEVLQNGNPYDCLQEDDRNTLVLWLLQESGRFTMMGRKWNLVNVCGEFILKFEGGAVWSLLKLGYYGAEPQTTLMFAVEFSGVPTILDPDEQVEFEFSP
ncbi:MAG: hypothetical protein EBQ92_00175 [Proteobacteria bacterium]|nr:hypothetical protein [Pseudomonadota bacterium]